MSDAFIEVAPDSTGKKLQTFENTVSANDVHAEAVVLVDQFGVRLTDPSIRGLPVQLYGYDYTTPGPRLIRVDADGKLVLNQDDPFLIDLGSGTAGPVQGEDSPSQNQDKGIPAMAVRRATPANTSDTDGDYEMLQMDGGKLWVKGPVTDAEIRATPLPVSGTVATGGLTDAQLRATAVPVSGPLTDAQLRATPVPVSGSFSLPTGAATEAKQDTQITDLGGVTETAPATDTASSGLNGRLQRIAQRITSLIALLPSSLGGKTAANSLSVTTATDDPELALIGSVTETAPATDTASSGLSGRLQRIAQRITSLITALGSPFQAGGSIGNTTFASTVANGANVVEGSTTGAAVVTDANGTLQQYLRGLVILDVDANTSLIDLLTKTGATNDTAAASDTATSSLNGRLQRIAQRITSLIALLPTSLGQKTKANSFAVTLASDSDTLPVSAASLPLPAGASTAAKQPALGTALAPSTDVLTTQRPAVTQVVSTAFEASKVLKASAGQLVQLSVFNSGPAQFILLMNSTTVPVNGAVTLLFPPIAIAAATLLVLDLPAPLVASTGIAVSNSTTGTFTKTLGAADCAFYAQVN